MAALPVSRRRLLRYSALAAVAGRLAPVVAQVPSVTHANVAELDRKEILAAAAQASAAPVLPPPAPVFFTETEPTLATAGLSAHPELARGSADALRELSATVAALAAGLLLTHQERFARDAVAHLRPWLLDPATRLQPVFDQAGCARGTHTGTPAGVVDLVPLAELARSLSFLTDALHPDEWDAVQSWFRDALSWLTTNREALIARDSKDHRASASLLLVTACARLLRDETTLEDCRKRFRSHTLRNQIRSDGVFPQEVATPNPYRNTLMNFDLLAGACQLLSSPFDLLWDYELIDGVGLRIVSAYLYPLIAHSELWKYPADAHFFRDLPGRRPGLLFAGRAYNRAEYVEQWLGAPALPAASVVSSFPIRQPALWTARAPHGL